MNDTAISCLDINPNTVQAVRYLKKELRKVGITLNEIKTLALSPMGHMPTTRNKALLTEVRVTTTEKGTVVMGGIPVGTGALVRAHAQKVVKDNAAERLARLLPEMPDTQAAMLIAAKSIAIELGQSAATGGWCRMEKGTPQCTTARPCILAAKSRSMLYWTSSWAHP